MTEALRVPGPLLLLVPRAEGAVRRGPATAQVAVVHDVVVQERCRLEDLHRAGGADHPGAVRLPQGAPSPVEERRPEPFPAGEEVGDGVHQGGHRGAEPGEHLALPHEVLVQGLLHAGAEVHAVQDVHRESSCA